MSLGASAFSFFLFFFSRAKCRDPEDFRPWHAAQKSSWSDVASRVALLIMAVVRSLTNVEDERQNAEAQ